MAAGFGKKLSWRIEALGHSFVAFLIGFLTAGDVFRFGEGVGKLIWPFMKARRAIILRNLRIACAPLEFEEAEKMARGSFIRTVANLLSSSISPKSEGGKIEEMLVIENPELLEELCAQGRGVVVLLAHMGNWELLTKLNRFFPTGTNSGAFYRPLNNPILNERVLKLREADGTRLFAKGDSLHQVGGFLKDNGIIGILADQRVGIQGEVVSFFGRVTRASPLASLLARRCKSEVLALSLRTIAPGKWSARYHRVEKPYRSDNCMKALEVAMKVSLLDCFWLQERWKVYVGKYKDLTDWFDNEDVRGEKPHRAMAWLGENEEKYKIPADFLHGDVEWEFVAGKQPYELAELDRSKPLPVDFLVTTQINPELLRYAAELGIPVLSYPDFKIAHP
jgi:Kdo2-lipid IVA lauroyltransferase/acyltransferase